MIKSKRYINYFRICSFWFRKLQKATTCYRALQEGIDLTAVEKQKLYQAARLLDQAAHLFSQVYAKRIGHAVTHELRHGITTGGRRV